MLRVVLACFALGLLFVAPYSYTLLDKSGGGEGRIAGVTWRSPLEGEPNAVSLAAAAGRIPHDLAKQSIEMQAYLHDSYELDRWDLNIGLLMLQWMGFALVAGVSDRLAARYLGVSKSPRRAAASKRPPPPPPPRPPSRTPTSPPSARPGPRPGPRR